MSQLEVFNLDETFEAQLKQMVKPLLERGRPGDWEHTLRAVEYAKYLLQHEKGEEEIVILTLYLHDIGWSKVHLNDYMHAPLAQKRWTESTSLHMKHGAVLSEEILEKLDYNPELSRRIVSIIAIHDEPEKIFRMGDSSAILVVEADRLDRYGPESLRRYSAMFGPGFLRSGHTKEAISYLRHGLKIWFKTPTAKALCEKLARDQGLFDSDETGS